MTAKTATQSLTATGKYVELYRELCGTNPLLNNQESEVIEQLAKWIMERENAALRERLERETAGCVCKGNWRLLVDECQSLLDCKFQSGPDTYTFFGLVHGSDDYYYGMWDDKKKRIRLLSCVGAIEGFGFKLIDATISGGEHE